ncbi:hypothetical protein IO44_03155 [Gallibacterium anatis str. Avicor]|uniref:hypothetical protein n=1 Tax=Gallibacterium anatis TaxID=750 RepID=UPI0005310C6B|nr:hypothetical protein [Gallibacterium anatis]KGQ56324.1 hypothetical protein IO44_03155 [Gallibacterium anatis str. Avicor]
MGRAYTIEERKAILNKMYELGKPPREAAKELGVCATSLYCWGKQHDAHRYYEFLKKVNPYYNHKHKAPHNGKQSTATKTETGFNGNRASPKRGGSLLEHLPTPQRARLLCG